MSETRMVVSTAPTVEVGAELAKALVERQLAACVNLIPGARSIYRWEGEVHDDAEVVLVIKTTAARCDACVEALVALHPYDVPEAVALPVVAGNEAYLRWIGEVVE